MTTALKTHRYLRLSFVFAVGALLIGVTIASVAGNYLKGSISYYYWTPARNVLVGVLIAASVAMLVLNGRGGAASIRLFGRWNINVPSPSTLLDFAAIFGPLIAIVPTDMKKTEQGLTTFTCEVNEVECLPKAALPDVQNAVLTYIFAVAVILAVMWFVRSRNAKRKPFALLVPVTAVITALALFVLTFVWNDAFPYIRLGGWSVSIHYLATFLFFAAFALVVWIRGSRDDDPEDRTPPTPRQKRWYKGLAVAMALDILFLVGLSVFAWIGFEDLFPGFPEVMVGEFAGLIVFAWFWAIQTRQRWNEVITPLPREGSVTAGELSRRLTPVE
ncbi:hypothetical protein [Microbacterium sp. BK668]|uniref:hypothetical protein n=1 Tax=Microbacterium sp. BK668 TaxID=2512118 RepID=UPI00106198FB|nr:hypothetical protein [Microbacterium sp. BK668]